MNNNYLLSIYYVPYAIGHKVSVMVFSHHFYHYITQNIMSWTTGQAN